jgi:hypothetical protein
MCETGTGQVAQVLDCYTMMMMVMMTYQRTALSVVCLCVYMNIQMNPIQSTFLLLPITGGVTEYYYYYYKLLSFVFYFVVKYFYIGYIHTHINTDTYTHKYIYIHTSYIYIYTYTHIDIRQNLKIFNLGEKIREYQQQNC